MIDLVGRVERAQRELCAALDLVKGIAMQALAEIPGAGLQPPPGRARGRARRWVWAVAGALACWLAFEVAVPDAEVVRYEPGCVSYMVDTLRVIGIMQ